MISKRHPSKYTPELAAEICRRISLGESLRTICKGRSMPARATVYTWLTTRSDFRILHAAARDFMVDSLAEEAIEKARTATNENAQAVRVLVDTIKWYVSKLAPKKYGDKLEMSLTGQISIGDAIEEGRKRVARLRDGESTPELPGASREHPTVN